VSGLRLVVHFLFPSVDALTGGMTRAAVSEGMRKVARGGLVLLSSVTFVSSALARSVATGSKVLRLAGLVSVWACSCQGQRLFCRVFPGLPGKPVKWAGLYGDCIYPGMSYRGQVGR
jgi:hypothetical protein